jgi:hypothetical protein
MGTITVPNTIANGDTSDATLVMANFTTIYNEFNGSIENANVKTPSANTAGIDAAKVYLAVGAFSAYLGAAQSNLAQSFTRVEFDTENFDVSGEFDSTSTKGRFTPTKAGYYCFIWNIQVNSLDSGKVARAALFKQTTQKGTVRTYSWAADSKVVMAGSAIEVANGSTDYFEIQVTHDNGDTTPDLSVVDGTQNYFMGFYVGDN